MNTLEKIFECEIEYAKCFCQANEQQDFIRFQDELIPDMHYHNFTWIKNIENDLAIVKLIECEINYSKNAGRDFCLIRCHIPVNKAVLGKLKIEPEISISGYYVFDISNLSRLNKVIDSSVVKVDNLEMIEDILKLDLEHDEESLGRDFCTRRVYRRKDVYLSNGGVDSYICYHNNKAIGNCDLFKNKHTAKIEDFAISPQNQRKGYGSTILKSLIEIALAGNVTIIYLETDEDDTAKEMYQKCGFYKVNNLTNLLFKL